MAEVTHDFERLEIALREYMRYSRKEYAEVLWKKITQWAFSAVKHLPKGEVVNLPTRKGESGNWRLVQYLAKRKNYTGKLTQLAQKERANRRKSTGFLKSMMLGLAKAGRRRTSLIQGRGIIATVTDNRNEENHNISASSRYRFKRELTSAMVVRDTESAKRKCEQALHNALPGVIADMQEYINWKIAESARKAGLSCR